MVKSDEFIANRIKWKAENYKLPSDHALYFDQLTDKQKGAYAGFLKTENIGIPVMIFVEPKNKNWTILGTRKILSNANGNTSSLLYDEIKDIKPHNIETLEKAKEAIDNNMPKSHWNELTLTDDKGSKRNIYATKGSDYFAMWNIIRMVRQLNLE